MSVIKLKTGVGVPPYLETGEPAFDKQNNIFYIGDIDGMPINIIEKGLSSKADKATTLKGYGITDAYTKEEIDSKGYLTEHQDISEKANKSDTYTKEEINTKLSSVYKYKGTKDYYFELPTNNEVGDVYNIKYASGEGYYEEVVKTYTDYEVFDADIPPFSDYGLSGFYISWTGITQEEFQAYGNTLDVGLYSPTYFSNMTNFTVPVLSSYTEPATSCAYWDANLNGVYIFVVDSEAPFNEVSSQGYDTKYAEIYDYITNHPWDIDEKPHLNINNETQYIPQLREPYIVNDGDNVAWNGEEWDILGGSIDLSSVDFIDYSLIEFDTSKIVDSNVPVSSARLGIARLGQLVLGHE